MWAAEKKINFFDIGFLSLFLKIGLELGLGYGWKRAEKAKKAAKGWICIGFILVKFS